MVSQTNGKKVAVIDAGTLISLATDKTENDDKYPLQYVMNTYNIHVPYEVVAEVNTIALDNQNQQTDETQRAARLVMGNADKIFDKVHYAKEDRPSDPANRFRIAHPSNGEVDEDGNLTLDDDAPRLSSIDGIDTETEWGGDKTAESVADKSIKQLKRVDDLDRGDAHVAALAAHSQTMEEDQMPNADVIVSDDVKSLSDMHDMVKNHKPFFLSVANADKQDRFDSDIDVLTTGDVLNVAVQSDKYKIDSEDAFSTAQRIFQKRGWTNDDFQSNDYWDEDENIGKALDHILSGSLGSNPTLSSDSIDDSEKIGSAAAGIESDGSGAKGSVVEKYVACGKNCSGCPHGPYYYDVWNNGQNWEYLGR